MPISGVVSCCPVRSFRSPNLGVRRLAVVLAVVGGLLGIWQTEKPLHALQKRRWDNAYFRSEIARHQELTLTQNNVGWYLMDYNMRPSWPVYEWDWEWRVLERFPRTADEPPKLREYFPLTFPAIGAFLAWLVVHTFAWIIAGFKVGASS
jgi:hypothetical protein